MEVYLFFASRSTFLVVWVGWRVYIRLPKNTMNAPIPSCAFHSFPNSHTLKHRLSALRAVRAIFVDTEDTC